VALLSAGLIWEPLLTRTMAVLNSSAATCRKSPGQRRWRPWPGACSGTTISFRGTLIGEGSGNANQGQQYSMYPAQNALMLLTHPLMTAEFDAGAAIRGLDLFELPAPGVGVPPGRLTITRRRWIRRWQFPRFEERGRGYESLSAMDGYGRWLLSALTPPEPRLR